MTVTEFGTTARGESVQRVTLRNDRLTVSLLTLGATLHGVWLDGVGYSLTLGSDKVADYQGEMRYHGVLVAPVVNRLTKARAAIDGVPYSFEANEGGLHTLHSGSAGSHLQNWTLADVTATQATLTLTLPDGAGGFPGTRPVRATFMLADPATLRLDITATTDQPTLFNVANHSYWNLDGGADWAGHRLQIAADRYLPTTDTFTPTGEIRATAGSAYDFRAPRVIAPNMPAMDTNFCLSDKRRALTPVLTLTGKTGISMTLATTEPGVQIYDGRNAIRPGRAAYEGLAIEAQNWPDAPNHAGFPDIVLRPGQSYAQTTEWRFATL